MKKLFTFIFLILICFPSIAANRYVSVSGSGAGTGLDWNNTVSIASVVFARGNTYYLSGGDYGQKTFNTANSGTSTITLRAATDASHGTDTGWNNSMDDTQVIFGVSKFQSDHWIVDGQSRTTWTSGYHYVIRNTTSTTGHAIEIDLNDTRTFTNMTFKYIEVEGHHVAGTGDNVGFYVYPDCNGVYVGYCWFHQFGGNPVQCNYGGGAGSNWVFEYNWFTTNNLTGGANHSECFSITASDLTIRYNYMQDIVSSGFITVAHGGPDGLPDIHNWEIYGNVMFWSSPFTALSTTYVTDGVIGFGFGETHSGFFRIYNNTIAGIVHNVNAHNAGLGSLPTGTEVYNNLWYNCTDVANFASGSTIGYNAYFGGSNNANDTNNKQTSAANPFVNISSFDFTLSIATSNGKTLSSPYNVDLNGVTRGTDGTWDRGAFELAPVTGGTLRPLGRVGRLYSF